MRFSGFVRLAALFLGASVVTDAALFTNYPAQGQTANAPNVASPRPVVTLRVVGSVVKNHKGEVLGRVEDVVLNPDSGQIDFGMVLGGYPENTVRATAVPWFLLKHVSDQGQTGGVPGAQQVFQLNIERTNFVKAPALNKSQWGLLNQPEWRQNVYGFYGYYPSVAANNAATNAPAPTAPAPANQAVAMPGEDFASIPMVVPPSLSVWGESALSLYYGDSGTGGYGTGGYGTGGYGTGGYGTGGNGNWNGTPYRYPAGRLTDPLTEFNTAPFLRGNGFAGQNKSLTLFPSQNGGRLIDPLTEFYTAPFLAGSYDGGKNSYTPFPPSQNGGRLIDPLTEFYTAPFLGGNLPQTFPKFYPPGTQLAPVVPGQPWSPLVPPDSKQFVPVTPGQPWSPLVPADSKQFVPVNPGQAWSPLVSPDSQQVVPVTPGKAWSATVPAGTQPVVPINSGQPWSATVPAGAQQAGPLNSGQPWSVTVPAGAQQTVPVNPGQSWSATVPSRLVPTGRPSGNYAPANMRNSSPMTMMSGPQRIPANIPRPTGGWSPIVPSAPPVSAPPPERLAAMNGPMVNGGMGFNGGPPRGMPPGNPGPRIGGRQPPMRAGRGLAPMAPMAPNAGFAPVVPTVPLARPAAPAAAHK